MKTELHLDSDEWATILLVLKLDHEKADGQYRRLAQTPISANLSPNG